VGGVPASFVGQPIAIFGSPAGGINPVLAQLGGLSASASLVEEQARIHSAKLAGDSLTLARHAPEMFDTYHRRSANKISGGARVLYSVEDSPALVLNTTAGMKVVLWDPPDLSSKEDVPLKDDWGGSGATYALTG